MVHRNTKKNVQPPSIAAASLRSWSGNPPDESLRRVMTFSKIMIWTTANAPTSEATMPIIDKTCNGNNLMAPKKMVRGTNMLSSVHKKR
mmetsp:Transcript_98913/g.176234  ORF Transcript_98913/g.176234 Transcript_98913/m.176234 type:complete len:89 (+) Transcript_98913:640-906(+)